MYNPTNLKVPKKAPCTLIELQLILWKREPKQIVVGDVATELFVYYEVHARL